MGQTEVIQLIKRPVKLQHVWIEEETGKGGCAVSNPRMLPGVLGSHCFTKGSVSKFTKFEECIYMDL